jgi:hypothetical protein
MILGIRSRGIGMFIQGDLSYAGISVVTVLSAGIGAYIGAYLKKKGENLATHEDLDKLVVELKATTETTKSIEARISNDLWVSQKGWELKRDILMQWFRSAQEGNEIAREAFFLIDKFRHDRAIWDSQEIDRLDMLKRWHKCYMSARSIGMDMRTVAGTELYDIAYAVGIQFIVIDLQLVNLTPTDNSLETAALIVSNARGAIKQLLRDALGLIRRELGIAVLPLASQSTGSSAAQAHISPTPG